MKDGSDKLRIAIFWSELPGYAAACVRALAERENIDLLVVRYAHQEQKPFDESSRRLPFPIHAVSCDRPPREQWMTLRKLLENFQPDAAVVSGWAFPAFNRAARWVKKRGGIVVCMSDNQWRGDLKQLLGAVYARLFFGRRYSAMFIPGERARPLARAFGFSGPRLITGSYSCDWSLFSRANILRSERSDGKWPHVFLFVGSLIPRKGIQDILAAYQEYRKRVAEPWQLWMVGDGPLKETIQGVDGVSPKGFKQPPECANIMSCAGAYIMASHKEPWGVVLHEAVAAGMPVICTESCGAGADFVNDNYNGYVFEAADVQRLSELMFIVSNKTDNELSQMGRSSYELSKKYTPHLWAEHLLRGLTRIRPGNKWPTSL